MVSLLVTSLLILLIVIIVGAVLTLGTPVLFRGGPFVATPTDRVATALRLAAVRPHEVVVDLGSGDGRLLIAAARAGARAIGYETNPWLVMTSRRAIRSAGLADRATVRWQNFWPADLSRIDVVFVYLLPSLLPDLEVKLIRALRPGSRVITLGWPLPTWPTKGSAGTVYLYRKP